MFNKDSIVVKTWVRLIENGSYTKEQIPNLSNLKVIVLEILG